MSNDSLIRVIIDDRKNTACGGQNKTKGQLARSGRSTGVVILEKILHAFEIGVVE
jgi:hypothetical protein